MSQLFAVAQSPGREAALAWASLAQPTIRGVLAEESQAKEGGGCGRPVGLRAVEKWRGMLSWFFFLTSGPSRRELSLPVPHQPTLMGSWSRAHTSFSLEPTAQSPLQLSEVGCSLPGYPIPDKTARLDWEPPWILLDSNFW